MSFASAIASFSEPVQNSSDYEKLNTTYIDKHDDIVMCNNCFSGHMTQGYILPKDLLGASKVLFPVKSHTAFFPDEEPENDIDFQTWAEKSTIQLDYCCLESTAYTYVWDNVINQCIVDNNITPCVYRFVYLFMKAMSRSPRIPPGTVLYRGTRTPFSSYNTDMRFMSFTTDIDVARRFSPDGQIGFYKVKQQDYIHGLWFDSPYGTSKFLEHEIMLGPGISVRTIGQINDELQELELNQVDIHTYFMDHYKPEGDKKFHDIVQTGVILIDINGKRTVCMSTEQTEHLKISEGRISQYIEPLLDLQPTIAGYIYVAVQRDEVMTIDTTKMTTQLFALQGSDDTQGYGVSYGAQRYRGHRQISDKFNINCNVYKALLTETNETVYCTFEGLCYMKFEMYDLKIKPLDNPPLGTQVIHANNEYKMPITISII